MKTARGERTWASAESAVPAASSERIHPGWPGEKTVKGQGPPPLKEGNSGNETSSSAPVNIFVRSFAVKRSLAGSRCPLKTKPNHPDLHIIFWQSSTSCKDSRMHSVAAILVRPTCPP